MYYDVGQIGFMGGDDCTHILADPDWPAWEAREVGMATVVREIGVAQALWGCADIVVGMLGKLILWAP